MNVLPFPTMLSKCICPPCNSTRFFVIAKPRPVPPALRVEEPSTCLKRSNMAEYLSSGIANRKQGCSKQASTKTE